MHACMHACRANMHVCMQGLQDDLRRAQQEAAAQLAKVQQAAAQQQHLLEGQVQAAQQQLAGCKAQLDQQAAAQQQAQQAWEQERRTMQGEAQVSCAGLCSSPRAGASLQGAANLVSLGIADPGCMYGQHHSRVIVSCVAGIPAHLPSMPCAQGMGWGTRSR
jgi:hypothetical protein